MPVDDILLDGEEKMEKAVSHLAEEFRGVRTGRASSGLVDHIKVDYYGSPPPLKQLANIGTLGITPSNDGKVIRLKIPPLSEERRRQILHHAKELCEAAKLAIRNIRRDGNKQLDVEKKDGAIPEDEMFRGKDEVQKLTTDYEKKVEDLLAKKTDEIMQV